MSGQVPHLLAERAQPPPRLQISASHSQAEKSLTLMQCCATVTERRRERAIAGDRRE